MKIIVVASPKECNNPEINALNIIEECPRLWFKADSALLKNEKPFFIPDFTSECSAQIFLALRISRMGKTIHPRHANRYFDALTAAVDFTAEDVLRQLRQRAEPWEMAKSFDMSVSQGRFVAADSFDLNSEMELSLLINGEPCSSLIIDNVASMAADTISSVSRFFTLRQGDLLLIGQANSKPLVKIDDHLEGLINKEKVLEFNVK